MTRLRQLTAAGLLLVALPACTPSSPATSTTTTTAATTSAMPTATPTPAKPVLTIDGWGSQRFGQPWQASERLVFAEESGAGPGVCSRWNVLGADGKPIGFAPSKQGKDAPVHGFQTLSNELDTGFGVRVGSTREVVVATGAQKIVSNQVQEAYLLTNGTHDLVIDLEPTNGEVVLITVVPTTGQHGSFYRTETICL